MTAEMGFSRLGRTDFENLARLLRQVSPTTGASQCREIASSWGGVADADDPELFTVPGLGGAEGDFVFVDGGCSA